MPRYGGRTLANRVREAQSLYQEGSSVDEVAGKIKMSRAIAWMNCQGFANQRDYRLAVDETRQEMVDLIIPKLKKIRKIECEIVGYETTRRGIRVEVERRQKLGNIVDVFGNSIGQTIIYAVNGEDMGQFGFHYNSPNISIHPKTIRGIPLLRGRAFLEAYAETVIKRQVEGVS